MKLVINISVLLISSFIHGGFSLKCWDCSSDIDRGCADPFSNVTIRITDCNLLTDDLTVDPSRCRKASRKEDDNWVILRGCGRRSDPDVQDDEKFCMTQSGPNSVFEELCLCNEGQVCNTSSTIKIIPLLSLISPIFFFMFQT